VEPELGLRRTCATVPEADANGLVRRDGPSTEIVKGFVGAGRGMGDQPRPSRPGPIRPDRWVRDRQRRVHGSDVKHTAAAVGFDGARGTIRIRVRPSFFLVLGRCARISTGSIRRSVAWWKGWIYSTVFEKEELDGEKAEAAAGENYFGRPSILTRCCHER